MSGYQVGIIVVLYVIIVLGIATFIPLSRILKRLASIEKLLLSTRQDTHNENSVPDCEGKNE